MQNKAEKEQRLDDTSRKRFYEAHLNPMIIIITVNTNGLTLWLKHNSHRNTSD